MILVKNGNQCLENWKVFVVLPYVMSTFSMHVYVFFGILLSRMGMHCQFMVWKLLVDECLFVLVGYIIELLVLSMEMSLNSLHLSYCECGVDFIEIGIRELVYGSFFLRRHTYLGLSLYIDFLRLGELKYGTVRWWWLFHSTLSFFEGLEPNKFCIFLSCYAIVSGLQKLCKYPDCAQAVWLWIVVCFV